MPKKRKARRFNYDRKLREVGRKTNPKVIEYLERMLQEAKEGKLTSFAAVFQVDGDHMAHVYAGIEMATDRFKYVGLLEAMKLELLGVTQ